VSEPLDFGAFSPAERRAALVQLTRDVLASPKGPPKFYPPKKDGTATPVKPGSTVFAAACWAKRRLESIEYAIRPDDGYEPVSSETSSQAGADDTPF